MLRQKVWDNFEAYLGREERGMCNIEVVDPPCPVPTNTKYLKTRDKYHSFPSSPHPVHVRLTILPCFASGQWGNTAMLIRFADQHCAEVLRTVHLYWESVGCILHLIYHCTSSCCFLLTVTCGSQTSPYSILSLCTCFWSQLSSQHPELLPLMAKFTLSQTFY